MESVLIWGTFTLGTATISSSLTSSAALLFRSEEGVHAIISINAQTIDMMTDLRFTAAKLLLLIKS
jgi:hypothetical protein